MTKSNKKEIMDLIDEEDEVIGTASRKEIREQNLFHRGVIIFVFNSDGNLFVQKRSKNKDLYPGKYDLSCSGAVNTEESYEDAACREAEEELGISGPLTFVRRIRYKDEKVNYLAHIYCVLYDNEIKLNDGEIESGKFVSLEELKKMLEGKDFCKEAKAIIAKYLAEIKEIAMA